MIADGFLSVGFRARGILRAIGVELRRLNNARTTNNELQSLSRKEQVNRVKAHLGEHHRGQARCC